MSNALMDALGYVGDSLEKPGRAVRGVLAGKGREALAAVPFSDSMGLTDYKQRTSGRDLTDAYGLTRKGDTSFGSHASGFAADMLTDPLNLIAGYGAYKAAPTLAKGLKAGAGALTGLDMIPGAYKLGRRALGRGGAKAASVAGHGDDLADMARLDSPLDGSLHFADRPMYDNQFGIRQLMHDNREVGSATYTSPTELRSREASELFPGKVHEGDPVRWITKTDLDESKQGKGLGQALYLDMMGRHPGDWFHSSDASHQASHAADALERKGLIEHYRVAGPDGEFPHAGRITDAGLEKLSHPDLLSSLMAGKGFPAPLPMPPRRPHPTRSTPGILENLLRGEAGAVGKPSALRELERWHAGNSGMGNPFGGIQGKADSLLDHQPWASDPDVPDSLRHAAGAVGPQYEGGLDKLGDLVGGAQGRWSGSFGLMHHGAAERIAGEFPPGTNYLGNGAEAAAFKAPDGHIIRVSPEESGWGSKGRADVPEIIQPFRSQKFHDHATGPFHNPWVVEHLPMVNPVELGKGHDQEVRNIGEGLMRAHGYDEGNKILAQYRNAKSSTDDHRYELANYLENKIYGKPAGNLDPWDFHIGNISTTNEGNLIGHDGGMIRNMPGFPELSRFSPLDNLSPDHIQSVLKNGGPEEVRAAMSRGNALGSKGQGVSPTGMYGHKLAEMVEAQRVMKAWMESNKHYGVDGLTPNLPGVTDVASSNHDWARFSPRSSGGSELQPFNHRHDMGDIVNPFSDGFAPASGNQGDWRHASAAGSADVLQDPEFLRWLEVENAKGASNPLNEHLTDQMMRGLNNSGPKGIPHGTDELAAQPLPLSAKPSSYSGIKPKVVGVPSDGGDLLRLFTDPDKASKPWYRAAQIATEEGIPTTPMFSDSWKAKGYKLGADGQGSALAHYKLGDKRIELNMGYGMNDRSPGTWHDNFRMQRLMDHNFSEHHMSNNHIDHTAFHELGHALHARSVGDDAMQQYGRPFDDKGWQQDASNAVSRYAADSPAETVAELYAALRGGRQFEGRNKDIASGLLQNLAGTGMMDRMSNQGLLKGVGLSALAAAYLGSQQGVNSTVGHN